MFQFSFQFVFTCTFLLRAYVLLRDLNSDLFFVLEDFDLDTVPLFFSSSSL